MDERVSLIREVVEFMFEATESWEPDHLGCQMAYLLGTIAEAKGFSQFEPNSDSRPLLSLLSTKFEKQHALWGYVIGGAQWAEHMVY